VTTGTCLPTIRVRVQAPYLMHGSLSTEREVLIGSEDEGSKFLLEIGCYLFRHVALQPTDMTLAFVR
jgi:hypothetical protein